MLDQFETIILDMNGTFMFGHDRFGGNENYGAYFKGIGGCLGEEDAHQVIQNVFDYLAPLYPDPQYRECFPSIEAALEIVLRGRDVSAADRRRLVDTFALHECGSVPPEYCDALWQLARGHNLGLVADIWAPRARWLEEFERMGLGRLFTSMSFSSDHGIVKPSPKPFLKVLQDIGGDPAKSVVIGDSVRRDLGGATAAGLSCILVGGGRDSAALTNAGSVMDLL